MKAFLVISFFFLHFFSRLVLAVDGWPKIGFEIEFPKYSVVRYRGEVSPEKELRPELFINIDEKGPYYILAETAGKVPGDNWPLIRITSDNARKVPSYPYAFHGHSHGRAELKRVANSYQGTLELITGPLVYSLDLHADVGLAIRLFIESQNKICNEFESTGTHDFIPLQSVVEQYNRQLSSAAKGAQSQFSIKWVDHYLQLVLPKDSENNAYISCPDEVELNRSTPSMTTQFTIGVPLYGFAEHLQLGSPKFWPELDIDLINAIDSLTINEEKKSYPVTDVQRAELRGLTRLWLALSSCAVEPGIKQMPDKSPDEFRGPGWL